jgi:hypothetical protein
VAGDVASGGGDGGAGGGAGRWSGILAVTLVVAMLAASTGVADAKPRKSPPMRRAAKAHLERGLRHYEAKRYDDAIREFRDGYAIDERPEFLFAMAQAERLSGDCASAVDLYRRFLTEDPPDRQAAAAREQLARCEEEVAAAAREQEEETPEPDAAEPPEPARVDENDDEVPPALRRETSRPRDEPSRRPWYRDPLGGVLLASGAAGIGVGVGFIVASRTNEADAGDAPTYGAHADLLDRAERQRTIGWIAAGAGAALVTGAVIRYAWGGDGDGGAEIAMTADGGTTVLVVTGRFR